jgi:Transmembrane family 220, helix
MKYIALIFTLIFILFAGWQYNDPDPMLWIPIYLIAAYVTFRTYQGKANPEMLLVLIVISFAGGLNSWTAMSSWEGFFSEGGGFSMKTVNQELAREACGLWICTVSFMICWEIDKFGKAINN